MRKLGLIAFANNGGLGAQTRRLAKMLKPERVLVVDSSGFSDNRAQHFDWYKEYEYFISRGMPSNNDVHKFLQNLTHVFTCENPYNFNLIWFAEKQGTKTYCQSNYEFCDNLDKPYLPLPTTFLMPSYWKIAEMKEIFGEDRVQHLPPPLDPEEFRKAREINMKRTGKPRFLHVIGTAAHMDRNGTLDLLDAVKLAKGDFEVVIKSQHPLSMNAFLDDPRVKYIIDDAKDNSTLYEDFDAMILPRRYGGLSLTCNEALMSGLPVIMTDISPNDQLLPKAWLVESKLMDHFDARSPIELWSADPQKLADKIDEFASLSEDNWHYNKTLAHGIAAMNFSEEVLIPEYEKLWI